MAKSESIGESGDNKKEKYPSVEGLGDIELNDHLRDVIVDYYYYLYQEPTEKSDERYLAAQEYMGQCLAEYKKRTGKDYWEERKEK